MFEINILFFDLHFILPKHWELFQNCFISCKRCLQRFWTLPFYLAAGIDAWNVNELELPFQWGPTIRWNSQRMFLCQPTTNRNLRYKSISNKWLKYREYLWLRRQLEKSWANFDWSMLSYPFSFSRILDSSESWLRPDFHSFHLQRLSWSFHL